MSYLIIHLLFVSIWELYFVSNNLPITDFYADLNLLFFNQTFSSDAKFNTTFTAFSCQLTINHAVFSQRSMDNIDKKIIQK